MFEQNDTCKVRQPEICVYDWSFACDLPASSAGAVASSCAAARRDSAAASHAAPSAGTAADSPRSAAAAGSASPSAAASAAAAAPDLRPRDAPSRPSVCVSSPPETAFHTVPPLGRTV